MTRFVLASSVLLLLGVSASAAPVAVKSAPAKTVKTVALICPVTGEKIASIKDAVGSSTYKGKTYYFCCSSCKPAFDKDPAKYAKTASAAPTEKPSTTHKM